MASIDFPNSPTVGDVFTIGSSTWEWNGVTWNGKNLGSISWDAVADKPTTFAPSAHTHLLEDITDYTPPVIPEVTFTNTLMLMGA
jgi:hypothetical protein